MTILQRAKVVFPRTEPSLADRLSEVLRSEGLTVVTSAVAERVSVTKRQKQVVFTVDGETQIVSAEEILLAAGKTPNTADLNLPNAGIEIDQRQAIRVTPFLQTSNANVYAAGDVTNLPKRLEMTAGHEGTLAAENALTGARSKSITRLYRTPFSPIRSSRASA